MTTIDFAPSTYSEDFFNYTRRTSLDSAQTIVPLIVNWINPSSVCDVGCGEGVWLSVYRENGVPLVRGIDGSYVARDRLAIKQTDFIPTDLSDMLPDLGRRFELAQSLEVAEHLPPERAKGFVEDLCRLSDVVLFSAAPPGQGGLNHINECPYEVWRDLFGKNGYAAFDPIRRAIANNKSVAPWYRFNTFLFIKKKARLDLCRRLADYQLAETLSIPDVSPWPYRLRKCIIAMLPYVATQFLASMVSR